MFTCLLTVRYHRTESIQYLSSPLRHHVHVEIHLNPLLYNFKCACEGEKILVIGANILILVSHLVWLYMCVLLDRLLEFIWFFSVVKKATRRYFFSQLTFYLENNENNFEKISYLEGKGIYFIYLMNTIKKAGKLCVCVSSAATMQGRMDTPHNYRNQLCWKIMISRSCCVEIRLWERFVGFLHEFRLGYKETSTSQCCDHYLYEDIEYLCKRVETSAIDPDSSHVKSKTH